LEISGLETFPKGLFFNCLRAGTKCSASQSKILWDFCLRRKLRESNLFVF
jgi:hypothetical protein